MKKKNKDLEILIPDYFEQNSLEKKYKKAAGELNSKIKDIMRKMSDKTYEAGEYTASFSIQDKSSMNEEALIKYLKNHLSKEQLKEFKLIKKKEYVDADILEDIVYNKKLSEEVIAGMESCKVSNPVEVLRVTKKKGDKK